VKGKTRCYFEMVAKCSIATPLLRVHIPYLGWFPISSVKKSKIMFMTDVKETGFGEQRNLIVKSPMQDLPFP
jgi:hypothetical protein